MAKRKPENDEWAVRAKVLCAWPTLRDTEGYYGPRPVRALLGPLSCQRKPRHISSIHVRDSVTLCPT